MCSGSSISWVLLRWQVLRSTAFNYGSAAEQVVEAWLRMTWQLAVMRGYMLRLLYFGFCFCCHSTVLGHMLACVCFFF
jgi:hypothetical protein